MIPADVPLILFVHLDLLAQTLGIFQELAEY